MNITTKREIGEDVFFMDNNRVCTGKIISFTIETNKEAVDKMEPPAEYYMIQGSLNKIMKYENEIFPSKAKLLNSL